MLSRCCGIEVEEAGWRVDVECAQDRLLPAGDVGALWTVLAGPVNIPTWSGRARDAACARCRGPWSSQGSHRTCVHETTKDAGARAYDTEVLLDATRPVNFDVAQQRLDELKDLGVRLSWAGAGRVR